MDSIKVRLKDDLTRYHPSLRIGTEGMTEPNGGMWARGSDRFVSVRFPETRLDVLWTGLEIIDTKFLAERAAAKKQFHEDLRGASEVVKYIGPRGGFKCISYRIGNSSASNGFKEEAEEIESVIRSYKIPIKIEIV
jgi:hypothetical protein